MDEKPYTKTLQDELDWKLLDQLYGVVAQISNFCFETKKFCVTTEFIILALLMKFTKDSLDHSLFVAGFLIPLFFWLLDATGYFYQVKLRGKMELIQQRLGAKAKEAIVRTDRMHVIDLERASSPVNERVMESCFNHSMWLYAILGAVDLIFWLMYFLQIIR